MSLDHHETGVFETAHARTSRLSALREELRGIGFVTDGMDELLLAIDKASRRKDNILILGESGTGKGEVAKAIQHVKASVLGIRGKMLSVNCAEFGQNMLESELFGYVGGSFTGANSKGRAGLIESANGGRLFLDEIGDSSDELQAKLLSVIESGNIRRVGSNEFQHADVQFIFATSPSKARSDGSGNLREDLFHRLSANTIEIPPFRDRPAIAKVGLIRHGFQNAVRSFETMDADTRVLVDDAVVDILAQLPYPGNVRQLHNVLRGVLGEAAYEYEPNGLPGEIIVRSRHLIEQMIGPARKTEDSPKPAPPGNTSAQPDHVGAVCERLLTGEKFDYNALLFREIMKHLIPKANSLSHLGEMIGLNRGSLRERLIEWAQEEGFPTGDARAAQDFFLYLKHKSQTSTIS